MNFFEQELRKIVGTSFPQTTYVGRSCYIPLGEQLRARVQFGVGIQAGHYQSLKITVFNRHDGEIDTNVLRLSDVLGVKQVSNPNFPHGLHPYIWDDGREIGWYAYRPSSKDYEILGQTLQGYLGVFQEQRQADTPVQQLHQTM